MSIYPAPGNRTNIYNDVDYTSNVEENASSGEIDDRYVKKTGSTMSGMLTVPILKFADNTTQHTGYDSVLMDSTVSDVSSNTYKLSTVNYDDSTVSIPDLSCNVLNVNGIQSQAFTSSDKFMISDNAGRVALLESDISTNSGRISVLEADVSEIDSAIGYVGGAGINFIKNIKVNDVGVLIGGASALYMNSFDGYNLVLDSGDDYTDLYSRTVYMGNSNGLTIYLRSPARINMNGESQNYAFSDDIKAQIETNTSDISTLQSQIVPSGNPVGTVLPFAGSSAPNGYLLCHGQTLLITSYQDLYDVIGTLYNNTGGRSPPSSGYFCLPDLRQCHIEGASGNVTYSQKITWNANALDVGEFQEMSVQDHKHYYTSANTSEQASSGNFPVTVGSNNYTSNSTNGVYYNDGSVMDQGVTRPNSIGMRYIIKY